MKLILCSSFLCLKALITCKLWLITPVQHL
nr:MAG TPA: hypothetical protein [Caudoviricetes sp.]